MVGPPFAALGPRPAWDVLGHLGPVSNAVLVDGSAEECILLFTELAFGFGRQERVVVPVPDLSRRELHQPRD